MINHQAIEKENMNRLKFSRAYLSGPMDRTSSKTGKTWRRRIGWWLQNELQVIIYDPYDKPLHPISSVSHLESKQAFSKFNRYVQDNDITSAKQMMKPIVSVDLRMVDIVDFIIAYFDLEAKPCGTLDEIITGSNQNKPVLLMCPQGIDAIYRWLWGRLKPELFFDNWGKLKDYLLHIAFDPDESIDCLDRWKFFDTEAKILQIINQDYTLIKKHQ